MGSFFIVYWEEQDIRNMNLTLSEKVKNLSSLLSNLRLWRVLSKNRQLEEKYNFSASRKPFLP